MATVRPGIYLENNPPKRSQWRPGRRDPVKSVIVVHTAESGTDRSGPDPKAERVAEFIAGRSDAGSYHLIGDSDSIIQLISFDNEAFHDRTGSNRWGIAISLAMDAQDWPILPPDRRSDLLDTAAQMAAIAARWLEQRGCDAPAARLLSKAASGRADASGFISHARRDPGRRSDPGDGFPWVDFFTRYRAAMAGGDPHVRRIQEMLAPDWYPDDQIDGIPGPITVGAVAALCEAWGQTDSMRAQADRYRRIAAIVALGGKLA